jgi:AraC family transcriptional regulator
VGGVTEWSGALSVVAKDAGVVHANDFGPNGARFARLALPAGTIGALIDDRERSCSWRWSRTPAVATAYLRLVRRAPDVGNMFPVDDPDVVDLLAALTARPASPPRGTPPSWLAQLLYELRSNPWCHPSVADVARRAGVHPVYLARSIRRWYGIGLGEELRRLRIQTAATAVAERCGTIADVAYARGFADEPHLSREFRRAAGMTPGRYRALVRGLGYIWRGGRRRAPAGF